MQVLPQRNGKRRGDVALRIRGTRDIDGLAGLGRTQQRLRSSLSDVTGGHQRTLLVGCPAGGSTHCRTNRSAERSRRSTRTQALRGHWIAWRGSPRCHARRSALASPTSRANRRSPTSHGGVCDWPAHACSTRIRPHRAWPLNWATGPRRLSTARSPASWGRHPGPSAGPDADITRPVLRSTGTASFPHVRTDHHGTAESRPHRTKHL